MRRLLKSVEEKFQAKRRLASEHRRITISVLVTVLVLFDVMLTGGAHAASQGPNAATAQGTVTGWTTATSAEACDSAYATESVASASPGTILQDEHYGFTIPAGSTINGIQVDFHKFAGTSSKNKIEDDIVQLIVGGSVSGSNLATATQWPTTNTDTTYGSSSTLWGLTPTVAQVNATNFGVEIEPQNVHSSGSSSALTADVDCVDLTITYTAPSLTFTQASYRVFNNQDSAEPSGTSWTTGASSGAWSTGLENSASVYFKGNYWVFGGYNGSTYWDDDWSSPDGVTWTGYGMPWSIGRAGVQALVFNGDLWVMGGYDGTNYYHDVYYSPDGQHWTSATSAAPWATRAYFGAAVLGNAMYIMGGEDSGAPGNDVWWSSDGSTWFELTSNAGWTNRWGFNVLSFNNELWVMGGYDASTYHNDVWCSPDGVTWSDTTCGTSSASWGIRAFSSATVFGNEMWLFAGNNSSSDLDDAWYSTNGSSWTQTSSGPSWSGRTGSFAATNGLNMWVMGGLNGSTYDGDTYYTSMPSMGVGSGLGSALAAANTAATVPGDGQPFRVRIDVGISNSNAIVNAQTFELMYAVQSGGSCSATPFANYTYVNTNSPVAYYANPIAVNGQSITYTSGTDPADGANTINPMEYVDTPGATFSNPTAITSGQDGMWDFPLTTHNATAGQHYCIQIANSTGPAALNGGVTNYAEIIIPSAAASQSNYRFYQNQDAFNSASAWTTVTSAANWGVRAEGAALNFNNEMWVMGGASPSLNNDVWCSTNGSSWSDTTCGTSAAGWSARDSFSAVVFNNKMWVLGGTDGTNDLHDVWCSSTGATWSDTSCGTTSAPWAGRYDFTALVYNNKIWVIGGTGTGNTNDVWSSPDGTNWTQLTTAVPWGTRISGVGYVFNNKMWVTSGQDGLGGITNDVWYSTDGINWIEATANGGFTSREAATGQVYNGEMWIMSGGYSYYSDVWYSSDGVNWHQSTNSTWGGREYAMSVVYNGDLWLMGGQNAATYENDVYDYSNGAVDVGTPWANQNTALDMTRYDSILGYMESVTPSPFRLRWDVTASGSQYAQSSSETTGLVTRLQYADLGSSASCSAISSGTWADVGSATPIRFYTGNTHAANGAPAMPDANDPTDGSNSIAYQTFNSQNYANNSITPVDAGDGLWDFALALEASPPHTSYCLRLVLDNGTGGDGAALTSNNLYPQINVAPVSLDLLRGREWWNSSGVREYKDIK